MKKFRKIMAVLVAAMMIMATMVPAFAAGPTTGRIETSTGSKITIDNVKKDETYTAWRMFDLASFTDTDTAPAVHIGNGEDEAYSYVIDETSPWYAWLLGQTSGAAYNANAAATGTVWAAFVPETGVTTPATNQLFWIEPAKVTVNGNSNYHVIYATTRFKNSADLPTAETVAAAQSADYLTDADAATVQKFAQEAVKWANSTTTIDNALTAFKSKVYGGTRATTTDPIVLTANSGNLNTGCDLRLGYYLLGTTQGTLCALDTNNPEVKVFDKNQAATLDDKWVLKKGVTFDSAALSADAPDDDTDTNWVHDRDARVGETVYFRTKITAMQGLKGYKLHDVMEQGLLFKTSATDESGKGDVQLVTLTRENPADTFTTYVIPSSYAENKYNWQVTYAPTDKCDFEIAFADEEFYYMVPGAQQGDPAVATKLSVLDGDVINVYYSAKVSTTPTYFLADQAPATDDDVKTAIKTNAGNDISSSTNISETTVAQKSTISDGDGRNTNWTILTYGGNSFTNFKRATVTVFKYDVVKIRESDTSKHDLLADAEFQLYEVDADATSGDYCNYGTTYGTKYIGNAIIFTKNAGGTEYTYSGVSATATDATLIKSLPQDAVTLQGLDAGEYLLVEKTAPTGYHKLAYPIFITINGGNKEWGTVTPAEGTITVVTKDNNNLVAATSAIGKDANVIKQTGDALKTYTDSSQETPNGGVAIVNHSSQELPSTGGMGTTVLYIVGGMLVVLAGAYLFFSRKRTA